jgi:D-alanine-D-alanine ligase
MVYSPKIIVITGGDTPEFKSSIATAKNIISQILNENFDIFLVELHDWKWKLIWAKNYSDECVNCSEIDHSNLILRIAGEEIIFDAAFIAIHGKPGESGHLQAYLEMIKIPYSGSGVLTSAIAIDKFFTKKIIDASINVYTPNSISITKNMKLKDSLLRKISYPCIVKPNSFGSGIEVALVKTQELLKDFVCKIHELGQDILIEDFIEGREVTVGAIVIDDEIITLPLAEILRPDFSLSLAKSNFFKFKERQSVEINLNAKFNQELSTQLYQLTKEIGLLLGCKDFYRVDFIVGPTNKIYFLEINTIPGMTEKSVFTKQLSVSEYDLKKLLVKVINRTLLTNKTSSKFN